MTIEARSYDKKKDFEYIMKFLGDLYEETKSYENWFPDRFENSSYDREDGIRIWEEFDDQLSEKSKKPVALTTRDSPRSYFLNIHPNYRHLEKEMIEWIEKNFKERIENTDNSKRKVYINILEGNPQREETLSNLGFKNEGIYGYYRIRRAELPIPDFPCPKGFTIRAIQDSDLDQQALLIQRVFGHGEWFTADVLRWIRSCSFSREELDLVAVTEDGTIASFCTYRVDPNSNITSLEPMGTNPDYRGLGLGKAIMVEGLKRAMKYNPPFFYIDGAANTPAANRLYDITGFHEKITIFSWTKHV
jgi:mycothiol synthase